MRLQNMQNLQWVLWDLSSEEILKWCALRNGSQDLKSRFDVVLDRCSPWRCSECMNRGPLLQRPKYMKILQNISKPFRKFAQMQAGRDVLTREHSLQMSN